MRISSATTGTVCSCSWGKTSRNQPIDPARESTAPSKLTEKLVTRPANNKVDPKARTKGQAVGAGTSISRGVGRLSVDCSVISKVAISFPQRPRTYTTVKTTTQTTSTKCQYNESTSTRPDCSLPTLPAKAKIATMMSMIIPAVTWNACKPTSE